MLLYLILLNILYLLILYYWSKHIVWRLHYKTAMLLKYMHYTSLGICIFVAVLFIYFDTGLRGLWTTRSIIFFTLLTGIFFMPMAPKSSTNKIEYCYFRFFSLFPSLVSGLSFVPFLGVVVVFSIFGQLISPSQKIYYEDDLFRVQSRFTSILVPPTLEVYEKKMLFEKQHPMPYLWEQEIDSISIAYDPDSIRVIPYHREASIPHIPIKKNHATTK